MKRPLSLLLALAISSAMMTSCSSYVNTENAESEAPYVFETSSKKVITDKNEIKRIVEEFELPGNPEDYVMIVDSSFATHGSDSSDLSDTSTHFFGNDIVFRNITKSYVPGNLLGSSTYAYPGGAMSISESVSATFRSDVTVDAKTIKSLLGIDITESITTTASQDVEIPKEGESYECHAYVKSERSTFDIYEEDLLFDDYLGEGIVDNPVGVMFFIKKTITPLLPPD